MADNGTAELVSVVSNVGTPVVIVCGFYQPYRVSQQIRLTKQKTNQSFGINIPLNSLYAKHVIKSILPQ